MEMDDPTLEEIHASPSPPVEAPGPSGEPRCNPTSRGGQQGLGHLLATRSSIDTRQRRQVSDFGMALCQTESHVTDAIKEVKALCTHTTREAEAHWAVWITEAKI